MKARALSLQLFALNCILLLCLINASSPAASTDLGFAERLYGDLCTTSADFGHRIATGDIDADSATDLVVAEREERRLYIYFGSPRERLVERRILQLSHWYANVVTCDLNNDSFSDIVIGHQGDGAITVIYGGSDRNGLGQSVWQRTISDQNLYETLVAPAGDVNQDGLEDLIIALPVENRAFHLLGFDHLLANQPPRAYPVLYDDFRYAIGNAGDVNGDGIQDFITTVRSSPQPVVYLALGSRRASLWTCGFNRYGQLATGSTVNTNELGLRAPGTNWLSIASKYLHSLAINSDKSLWAWGENSFGQLGNGGTFDSWRAVQIGTNRDWRTIAAGNEHSVALKNDGTMWTWGRASRLGDGSIQNRHTPAQVGTNRWKSVVAGTVHTLAIRSDGTLWAWGENSQGRLGDGTLIDRNTPVQIGTASNWMAIAAGDGHSLALTHEGNLWGWGKNFSGQVGDGTTIDKHVPTRIGLDRDWHTITAGFSHSIALKTNGTLWAWGYNADHGQVGDGTTSNRHIPTQIGTRRNWVAAAGGSLHTLALQSDGTLWSWGSNLYGQLGDRTMLDRRVPTRVGTRMNWVAIAAGSHHSVCLQAVEIAQSHHWAVQSAPGVTSTSFGDVVGSAGDINGDGFGDIIVTDPWHDGRPNEPGHLGYWGRVYIWYGGPSSSVNPSGLGINQTPNLADIIIDGGFDSGASRIYGTGDFDGDRFSDLALGDIRGAQQCRNPDTGVVGIFETGHLNVYLSSLAPPDRDGDGVADNRDNCVQLPNPGQDDADRDGVGDACDNCPAVRNADQLDADHDGLGDACDPCPADPLNDIDGDGFCAGAGFNPPKVGEQDNCPMVHNPAQIDVEGDGVGDLCDNCLNLPNPAQFDLDGDSVGDGCDNCPHSFNDQGDNDGDLVGDSCDNCPGTFNTDQIDTDNDRVGNACDPDDDNDGVLDSFDNCPLDANPNQQDVDGDLIGDLCDDSDRDGIVDFIDNCPFVANPLQQDQDGDGRGNMCDDSDRDGILDSVDNCWLNYNPGQEDADQNGIGDVCSVDLRAGEFEVTQAIQNRYNSVPLIRGKLTSVRVYVNIGTTATGPVSNVTGRLIGYLPGGGRQEITPVPLFITAKRNPDPAKSADTLNFRLPDSWMFPESRTMLFDIVVNPSRTVSEINYNNNLSGGLGTRLFYEMPPLNLMFVPVKVNGCVPTDLDFIQCTWFLKKVYPISSIGMWRGSVLDYDQDPSCHKIDLLWEIIKRNTFTDDPAARMHYYGLVCLSSNINAACKTAGTGGEAFLNDEEAWGMMDDSPSPTGARMAHELGHNLGLKHVADSAGPDVEDSDPHYPQYLDRNGNNLPRSSIGEYGFDYTSGQAYDPASNYDFMSYRVPEWVSPYHYSKLFNRLWGGASPQNNVLQMQNATSTNQYFFLGGILFSNAVHLDPIRILPMRNVSTSSIGRYSIDLFAADGALLATRYFDPPRASHHGSDRFVFLEPIEYFDNAALLVLKHENLQLASLSFAGMKPNISVAYPNGGETLSGLQTIAWSASDSDSERVVYDISYSIDGGANWTVIALGVATNTYAWDTGRVPGTTNGLIRVMAMDGVNTAMDLSDAPFHIAKKAPLPLILSPTHTARYFLNELITFEGAALDSEDGFLDDASLAWSSALGGERGPIGKGSRAFGSYSIPGQYQITLAASDKDGNTAFEAVTVQILPIMDGDGDGIGDPTDNCASTSNPTQADYDGDGIGDACDDSDYDGIPDADEPLGDGDNDGNHDRLDPDSDNDGVSDGQDNIPWLKPGVLVIEVLVDGRMRLSWGGTGFVLQASRDLLEPWSSLPGQSSPFQIDPRFSGRAATFYRLIK